MAASIASLNIDVTARTASFVKGLRSCIGESQSFAKQIGNVGSEVTSFATNAAALVGVSLSVSSAISTLRESMEEIDAAAKVADRLGVTTEALIGLRHAADLAGPGAEGLDNSLEQLARRLGDIRSGAGREAGAALERLGLNAQEIAGMNPGAAFSEIAEAISKIKNPTDQAAAAFDLFGRQGQDMLNMLAEGKAGLRAAAADAEKLGLTFDRLDAAAVEEANDAMTRLQKSVAALANSFAIELAPAIKRVADELARAVNQDAVSRLARLVGVLAQQNLSNFQHVNKNPESLLGPGVGKLFSQIRKNPGALKFLGPGAALAGHALGKMDFAALTEPQLKFRSPEADKGPDVAAAFQAQQKAAQEWQTKMREIAERVRKDAADVFESTRTPLERFRAEHLRLGELLNRGAISTDTFHRAMANAVKDFREADPAAKAFAAHMEELKTKAESIRASVATPLDEFRDKFAELVEMGRRGLIDPRTFELAKRDLEKSAIDSLKVNREPLPQPTAVEAGSAQAVSLMAQMEGQRDMDRAILEESRKTVGTLRSIERAVVGGTPILPASL